MAFLTEPILDRRPSVASRADARLPAPQAQDPDLDLVELWQAGDEASFATLVRRHHGRTFGLLFRMLGDREEAEDALQETFLNLYRHGHRFRGESRFSTFVYRVAVNAALNRRRSLGRRRAQMERLAGRQAAGDDLPGSPCGPEVGAARNQLRQQLQREIGALSANLQAPLVLYDIEGLPYGEIARILELPEGTVKSRIHRARRALRTRLASVLAEEAGD